MNKKRAVITAAAIFLSAAFVFICLALPNQLFQQSERALFKELTVHPEISSSVPAEIRENPLALSLYSGAMFYDYDRNRYLYGENEPDEEDASVIYAVVEDVSVIEDAMARLVSAGVLSEDTAGTLSEALLSYGGSCAVNVTKKGQTSYAWPISEHSEGISISVQRDSYTGTVTSFSWRGAGQDVSLEDTAAAYLSYLGFSENTSFSEGGRDMPSGREIISYSPELQLCVTISRSTFGDLESFALQVQSMTLDEYLRAVG